MSIKKKHPKSSFFTKISIQQHTLYKSDVIYIYLILKKLLKNMFVLRRLHANVFLLLSFMCEKENNITKQVKKNQLAKNIKN